MRWATRQSIHIDRAASAWLIDRFIDPDAEFGFVADPADVPHGAIPFDMRGVDLSHHGTDCTFETLLRRYQLDDPALWRLHILTVTRPLFDGAYEYLRRHLLSGKEPA